MTTHVHDTETESTYLHSDDDEEFPSDEVARIISMLTGGGDDDEDYDEDGLEMMLEEAQDYVWTKNKGALSVSLYGPSGNNSTSVGGVVTYVGKMTRIEEGGAEGYLHPSFESYHRTKKFINFLADSYIKHINYEEKLYFDCESDPEYHHPSHPGTLTVRGYGRDCWDYVEEREHGLMILRPGFADDVVPTPLPGASVKQLLRRVDDLKKRRVAKFGVYGESRQDYFKEEDVDLRQLIGEEAMAGGVVSSARDIHGSVVALLNVLNRGDVFADLRRSPCIAQEWNRESPADGDGLGMWTFIWQMVITTELARRLATGEAKGGSARFSRQVLASLIIAERWMSNVELRITEELALPAAREVSPEEKEQAEGLLALAEEAMEDEEPEVAAQCLAVAMVLDPSNIIYRRARCRALILAGEQAEEVGNKEGATQFYSEGVVDARRLTQFTPNDWKAWEFLADAQLGRGAIKKCLQAWEQALTTAEAAGEGDEAKKTIRENIAAVRVGLVQEFLQVSEIADPAERHRGLNQIKEWDFDILGTVAKWWSNVHSQQEEGLVKFAESLQWPYVDEVRGYVPGIFERTFAGQEAVARSLHDWLYGLLLPGNWYADSIMTTLVACTASLAGVGFSSSENPGLVLPNVTYWRTTTVLGRVLGGLPGVQSVNGWVGPCPPVQINLDFEGEPQMLWVDVGIIARVPPKLHEVPFYDPVAFNEDGDEDAATYAACITDPASWTIPKSPDRDHSEYTLKAILLTRSKEDERSFESEDLKCEAHLNFAVAKSRLAEASGRHIVDQKISSHEPQVQNYIVTLCANPAFVVPPSCEPSGSDSPGHPVHAREIGEYQLQTWTPGELIDDDNFAKASLGDIIVINATGNGAETMARAVCAFRGLNAVIRIPQGLCYKCAVKATKGLKMGVLIWCS